MFAEAPYIHLAGSGPDGHPVIRVVHGVVVDGQLMFHAANAGEKLVLLDRPVVATTQQVVAELPSYMFDAQRACPATTYYRSAQASGVLRAVEDRTAKARVMQALMRRFQPEGGHVPITADDPRYATALKGLHIASLDLQDAVAKIKLGQNRRPEQRASTMEALWERGVAADPAAIEAMRSVEPPVPTPAFLRGPADTTLCCALTRGHAAAAAALLDGTYWDEGVSREAIERAQLQSAAWVGAVAADGRLVATARAVSDGVSFAYVADVCVADDRRGQGIGRAVMTLLLDHPQVRAVRRVVLRTRDAQPVYERLGFVRDGNPAFSTMVLRRGADSTPSAA